MKKIGFSDIDLLEVGHTIQLTATIYSGNGRNLICVLPNENPDEIEKNEFVMLPMNSVEWEQFLRQADLLNVQVLEGVTKAIVRKSQRQIDQNVAWEVFRRDSFKCRYCGNDHCPLTVDHIDLWEEGGVTIVINLLTCCKPCNRARGNMHYEDWINSEAYKARNRHLTEEEKLRNINIISTIEHLKTLRSNYVRSR